MGNVLFLMEAAEFAASTDPDRWRDAASGIAGRILQGAAWRAETPGLMTGLAGVGLGLLRLYDPERVPSVLVLESPRRTRQ
jgi:hypothetical protein